MRRVIKIYVASLLLSVLACGPAKPSSDSKEAMNRWNRPLGEELAASDLMKHRETIFRRETKPWSDGYWPFYRKGLADRYLTGTSFASFDDQIASASVDDTTWLSPAEKYDLLVYSEERGFAATKFYWSIFDHYVDKYGDDFERWSWMGICSGWSPASLNENEAPLAAVANSRAGPLVFFESDLRALMSAVYDANRLDGNFRSAGLRCNIDSSEIQRDANGRMVDGLLTSSDRIFRILRDWRPHQAALQIQTSTNETLYVILTNTNFYEEGDATLYTDRQVFEDDLASGQRTGGTPEMITFYHQCRDINPATFHTTLMNAFAPGRSEVANLILETSSTHQVWNFPLWGFQYFMGPLRLVTQDAPQTKPFRHPRTLYVADVELLVDTAKGISPRLTYADGRGDMQADRDSSSHRRYKYTLEFDRFGKVIGGEWVHGPLAGSIDFLWQFNGVPTEQLPNGDTSPLSYTLIRKLWDCSLGYNGEEQHWLDVNGQPVTAHLCGAL